MMTNFKNSFQINIKALILLLWNGEGDGRLLLGKKYNENVSVRECGIFLDESCSYIEAYKAVICDS